MKIETNHSYSIDIAFGRLGIRTDSGKVRAIFFHADVPVTVTVPHNLSAVEQAAFCLLNEVSKLPEIK